MSGASALRRTNCRLCGYLCGLLARVEDGRVVAVEPDPSRYPYDAAIVRGCRRFRSNPEILDHPQRLNYPLKRVGQRGGGRWERITWDQALDEITDRLQALKERYEPETLATSIGGARAVYWPLHRFMNLFGSPNNIGIGQMCWNPAIWVHTLTYGWPIENELDPETTGCAVLWGTNPSESDNALFWRTILRFTRSGGKLIVVDPRRTRTAARAELWLPVRPGTDGALALGMLHVILSEELYDRDFVTRWCHGFERLKERVAHCPLSRAEQTTGVPAEEIARAARLYAHNRPATIISGRGIDQIGPNSAQTLRALAILRAVTGNVDVPGASHLTEMPDFVPEVDFELGDQFSATQHQKQLGGDHFLLQTYRGYGRIAEHTEKAGKRLPMRYLTSAHPNLVWRAMLEGDPYPIRALIVMASNPLLSHADSRLIYSALKSLDLLVVLELFLTPTAMLADYVLPVAGGLERPTLQTCAGVANIAYGGDVAVQPLYERRTDFYFWRELGVRLGQQAYWPWRTFRESFDDTFAPTGLTWEAFCEAGLYSTPPRYRKHEESDERSGVPVGFATPSGRVELYSELLTELGYDPLPGHTPFEASAERERTDGATYPLLLITGARRQPYYASEFRQVESLRRVHPRPWAEVSAATVEALDLQDEDEVWVETSRGRARFTLKIAPMRAGVVSLEYGWWYPEQPASEPSLGGVWVSNANLLTDADVNRCDPLLGQWRYNGLPCRVYQVDEGEKAT